MRPYLNSNDGHLHFDAAAFSHTVLIATLINQAILPDILIILKENAYIAL